MMIKIGLISAFLPERSLITVQLRKPKEMPIERLYVNGISTSVRKDGMASSGFPQLILVRGRIINDPTKTKAIELAMDGITESKGEKNRKGRNNNPAVTAVAPVRPPSSIPTADSM